MRLAEQLTGLRGARLQRRISTAYAGFVNTLDRAQVTARALSPGAAMPGFLLPNEMGQSLSSAELLESGPLVVTFFREGWCPCGMATLAALEEALPEIRSAGATLVAVTPDGGGCPPRAERGDCWHYEVLADAGNEVAVRFGITADPPEGYRALLAVAGIGLAARHGDPAGFIPLPATFVVGSNGIVRNAWIDLDLPRRVEPSVIVDALRRVCLASGHPLLPSGRRQACPGVKP